MALLSVITINYNNANGLKETFASVFSQRFTNYEYIVIDGGSSDGSSELLQKNKDRIHSWISEPDHGIYEAMNKGIARASSEYLIFLNSGDRFADESTLSQAAAELDGTGIVYGDLITDEADGKKKLHHGFDDASVYNLLLGTIWHPCAFIKRELFEKFGPYDTSFRLAGDYEFFVRVLLRHGASSKHISRFIACFDMSGVSNMSANDLQMKAEREKAWKANFSDPMIAFFKNYARLRRSREYRIGSLITKFFPG